MMKKLRQSRAVHKGQFCEFFSEPIQVEIDEELVEDNSSRHRLIITLPSEFERPERFLSTDPLPRPP